MFPVLTTILMILRSVSCRTMKRRLTTCQVMLNQVPWIPFPACHRKSRLSDDLRRKGNRFPVSLFVNRCFGPMMLCQVTCRPELRLSQSQNDLNGFTAKSPYRLFEWFRYVSIIIRSPQIGGSVRAPKNILRPTHRTPAGVASFVFSYVSLCERKQR